MPRLINEDDLDPLSKCLDIKEWQNLGRSLKIPHSTLEQIEMEGRFSNHTYVDKAFKMLQAWFKSSEEGVCTFEKIIEELNGLKLRQTAQHIEKKFLKQGVQQHANTSLPETNIALSNDPPASADRTNPIGEAISGVVLIKAAKNNLGSGFFVSRNLIVTNDHVIRTSKDETVQVFLSQQNNAIEGRIKHKDSKRDLAVVEVQCNPNSFSILKFHPDPSSVQVGCEVYAIGNPVISNVPMTSTATKGIISNALRRAQEIGETDEMDYIQTDAFIKGGNSGGPLVDKNGYVVGVVTSSYIPGISFVIPVTYVQAFLNELDKPTKVSKAFDPYIGLTTIPLSANIIEGLKDQNKNKHYRIPGVLICEIDPSSPAANAGLKPNDIIYALNDAPVRSYSDIVENLKSGNNSFSICREETKDLQIN